LSTPAARVPTSRAPARDVGWPPSVPPTSFMASRELLGPKAGKHAHAESRRAPETLQRYADPLTPPVRLAPEVADALAAGVPVVALETSIVAQGLPAPHNLEAALACEAA